jgi:hypothetical protein
MRLLSLCVLVQLVSCAAGTPRGVPLYDGSSVPERERNNVAVLTGPVTVVDGKNVASLGQVFELLPGCHVAQIGGHAGHVDPIGGGWVATLPRLRYAFRMRAGHTYTIEVEPAPALGFGPTGDAQIIALDNDGQGNESEVPVVRGRDDIEACWKWTAESVPSDHDRRSE